MNASDARDEQPNQLSSVCVWRGAAREGENAYSVSTLPTNEVQI